MHYVSRIDDDITWVAAAGNIVVYILPLALIIGGGYLILRTFFPRHSD